MSRSGHIYDITPEDFNTMVLENSFKGLVLVYFWSQNVGPCMKLLPNLIRLADEFSGRFLLNLLDRAKSFFCKDKRSMRLPCSIRFPVRLWRLRKLVWSKPMSI